MSNSQKHLYEYINDRTEKYRSTTDIKRMIIDYISGQTDKFFLKECQNNIPNFKI